MTELFMEMSSTVAEQEPAHRVMGTTEPFFFPGSGSLADTALYMIHGFTGSPSELRRLGYYLNDLGYTVKAIRLPGHGTTPEDMIRTDHHDWWNGVLEGYAELVEAGYKRIIPVGHSMGGLLALRLATKEKLPGVVSLSTPIYLGTRKTALARVMRFFVKYIKKNRPNPLDPIVQEAMAYDRTPVPCVVSFRKVLFDVKKRLADVKVPVFIGQGELDGTALPHSAQHLFDHVGSELKEMKLYPGSSHALLLDRDREQVYADIRAFLDRL